MIDENWPPLEWVKEETTFEEIKAHQEKELAELGIKKLTPNPNWQKEWNEFVRMKKDGYTLHLFRSSDDSWRSFSGAEGYVICDQGNPVAHITTKRS